MPLDDVSVAIGRVEATLDAIHKLLLGHVREDEERHADHSKRLRALETGKAFSDGEATGRHAAVAPRSSWRPPRWLKSIASHIAVKIGLAVIGGGAGGYLLRLLVGHP